MRRSLSPLSLDTLRESFLTPSHDSRPTPLYWWSGADLDRHRLEWQLGQLSEKGIGGTVVGYSHRPDGSLDHGDPEPLSPAWWALFRWFVEASGQRGMTVGIQDYGIIGGVLVAAADRTRGLSAGSLENDVETITGPAVVIQDAGRGTVVSCRAIDPTGLRLLDVASIDSGRITWTLPAGEWTLSTVRLVTGKIGLVDTDFDPMHPLSGAAVIDIFYSRFVDELGDLFGRVFTTFFQDELDLGIMMPMWNHLVRDAIAAEGFVPDDAIHALWHDVDDALRLRAVYRDTVVALLEQHYFRPIFEWHERHSTMIVMDQMSRGDLRLGHAHYADFMQTMAWYHGPGNDDPDLTAPRSIAAFKTSASIAHLHDRPRVTNEAFHSSGWGVTPQMIVGGLNIGFAAGVNQVLLHGLDYTTDGGWWEWASPDFHFRQPWWTHSASLWTYIARVSEMMRSGVAVSDVGVLDPTPDLDFDSATDSPEVARRLLVELTHSGVNGDFVPQAYLADSSVVEESDHLELAVLYASYRAMVVPGLSVIRQSAFDALSAFAAAGGTVIAVGTLPTRTEFGPLAPDTMADWHRVGAAPGTLAAEIRRLIDVDCEIDGGSVIQAHRTIGDGDVYFFVNSGDQPAAFDVRLRSGGALERWDPWTGEIALVDDTELVRDDRGATRLRTVVHLAPQESILLGQSRETAPAVAPAPDPAETTTLSLDSGWTASVSSPLDNRFGDYVAGGEALQVATYHLESAPTASGPWSEASVDHGVRFWALGPVPQHRVDEMDRLLPNFDQVDPSSAPTAGLSWRPYRVSLADGLENDPYLLERRTGPHGLKGVSAEFLDPRFLDDEPEPGSAYYFWSTVASDGESSTLTSRGRCAYTVWVDGVLAHAEPETAAAFFPPWDLRDMSTTDAVSELTLGLSRTAVLVKVVVSADQPSRVAAVIGGTPPERAETARMRWWQGAHRAKAFTVDDRETDSVVWIRAAVPVGATHAHVQTLSELVEVKNATAAAVADGYRIELNASTGPHLTVGLGQSSARALFPDAGSITAPITWTLQPAPIAATSWQDLGLRDFSGMVTYEREVVIEAPPSDRIDLVLTGVEGSAEVVVNGVVAGVAYSPLARIRIDHLLTPGPNRLRIDVANTLVNLFSRLPSPFAVMQKPGGGFERADLVLVRTASPSNLDRSDD